MNVLPMQWHLEYIIISKAIVQRQQHTHKERHVHCKALVKIHFMCVCVRAYFCILFMNIEWIQWIEADYRSLSTLIRWKNKFKLQFKLKVSFMQRYLIIIGFELKFEKDLTIKRLSKTADRYTHTHTRNYEQTDKWHLLWCASHWTEINQFH